MPKLTYSFYSQNVVDVAQQLIGKKLHYNQFTGIITETEAYRGIDDEASHAFKKTPRSLIMYGPPGLSYVYMIYGMYYCLNVVTEEEGSPSAVLIRGLMLPNINLNGPGKICKFLEITKIHNGIDLLNDKNFYIAENDNAPQLTYKSTPRIGITKATDKLWRFVSE